MDCQQVQGMLSAFLDDRVMESERRILEAHLQKCTGCHQRHAELGAVRAALGGARSRKVSNALALSLQVIASKEAARRRRRVDFRARFNYVLSQIGFTIDTLMKPVALPAAGGLTTAVLLFLAVLAGFRGIQTVPQPGDVPTVFATEPWIKSALLDTAPGEITVDVLVDEQGRVMDYNVVHAATPPTRAEMRSLLGNSMLFTQFHPATSFGQPTTGWVRVRFRRQILDVQG
jgi:anti-sigma factor RsiW